MTAETTLEVCPAPEFAIPPYVAVEYVPGGWAGVENAQGFNCLSFPSKPGAKFTTFERALEICHRWNSEGAPPSRFDPRPAALATEQQKQNLSGPTRRAIEIFNRGSRGEKRDRDHWRDEQPDEPPPQPRESGLFHLGEQDHEP